MALPPERTCRFPGEARPGANLPRGKPAPRTPGKAGRGCPGSHGKFFWALCQVAYREGSKNSDNSHNH